ncbi:single-stranded DNA-binding protein [Bifidobacterium goeldii]|uniref:Single-stranded DNA-binding protein n=1 Tax=Bifidobacterium goeldii TaxID=2306975 RepID=A0A430FG17_9BIFI|nr:single-stranded DNA-binding protein [Bifidobacterium goeldii]RSX51712.1 single-stranded DNA-binding protein [Bifidobacterium goeldii]
MAIQQGTVTVTGFVGAEPTVFGKEGMLSGCTFRLGSTRSYMDATTREWRNMPTTWLTVKAFRQLASNVRMSLHKGDAVIVTGLLNTEQWNAQSGESRSRLVLEASSIGHDLNYGVSELKRFRKSVAQSDSAQTATNNQAAATTAMASANAPTPGADPWQNNTPANTTPPPLESMAAEAEMPPDTRDGVEEFASEASASGEPPF